MFEKLKNAARRLGIISGPENRTLEDRWKSAGEKILGPVKLFLVDVGGAAGFQPHWLKYIGNSTILVFEPNERSYMELLQDSRNTRYRQDIVLRKIALSEKGGSRTFYEYNAPTGSSFFLPPADHPMNKPTNSYIYPIRETTVETRTLSDVLRDEQITLVDGIKLDVQGAELEILMGMGNEVASTLLLLEAEVNLQNVYEEGTNFRGIDEFAKSIGLELFDVRSNRTYLSHTLEGTKLLEKYFGPLPTETGVAAAIWEFDVVYMLNPSHAFSGRLLEPGGVRKLIYHYCVYNFYTEALLLLERSKNQFSEIASDFENIVTGIREFWQLTCEETAQFAEVMKAQNNDLWAQYMWIKYPSG